MSVLADDELLEGFERGSLPSGTFHHAEHVRVAWLYVSRYGMPEALIRFSAALKGFAAAKGATMLYHETITWAFLLIVAERARRTPAASWPAFAAAHPDLLQWKPSILDRYYTGETLWSDEARGAFVMPDRLASSDGIGSP